MSGRSVRSWPGLRSVLTLGRYALGVWLVLPLIPLLLWAYADRWSYPDLLPQQWGNAGWVAARDGGAGPGAARSLVLAVVVAAVALVVGALAARALTFGQLRHAKSISILLLAPVAVPPLAIVMGLNVVALRLMLPPPVAVGAVLVVAAIPYTTYTMRVAYGAYDLRYEDEARTLGASPGTVLRRVQLPLLAPGLAGAAFLAFLVAWSDYIVTLVIGGGQFVTLPLLVASNASGTGNEAAVAAISVAAVAPPIALLAVISIIGRRGRSGRRQGRLVQEWSEPTSSRAFAGAAR